MPHPSPHRIDTHHHIFPTGYLAKERARILGAMMPPYDRVLDWTPRQALDAMDEAGIATAVTSISTPGVWFGDGAAACTLARLCNEFAAGMARAHPGRFGFFAALPLPDIEGSLREIEYAFDVLQADGIGLLTNYDAVFPGDARFAPVFDELNRRKAVVYFHPTAAACCVNLVPQVAPGLIEFAFDTTRAIVSLLFGGTLHRCRDIRFIFSHGGGTLPMLAARVAALAKTRNLLQGQAPQGVMAEFQRLYYDTASLFDATGFEAARRLAGETQLLLGTDFPFWPPEATIAALAGQTLDAKARRAIERDNALRLFPRFAT